LIPIKPEKKRPVTDAKEVGQGMSAEETCRHRTLLFYRTRAANAAIHRLSFGDLPLPLASIDLEPEKSSRIPFSVDAWRNS
jgi:hypothetical protein